LEDKLLSPDSTNFSLSGDITRKQRIEMELSGTIQRLAGASARYSAGTYNESNLIQLMSNDLSSFRGIVDSDNSEFDFDLPYQPTQATRPDYIPETMFLNGIRVGSRGNATTIVGWTGYGKSSICESIMAARINPDCDSLGWSLEVSGSVHYCDMERSKPDFWASFDRVLKRAEMPPKSELPDYVRMWWLSEWDTYEKKKNFILYLMDRKKPSIIILDNATDLIPDTNNAEASGELLLKLTSCAKKHGITLVLMCHGNPPTGDAAFNDKPRGHFGGEAMRKSECVLAIKRKDEIRDLTPDYTFGKNRSASQDIHSFFKWDDTKKMMVSAQPSPSSGFKKRTSISKISLVEYLIDYDRPDVGLPWNRSELVDAIMVVKECSHAVAKATLTRLQKSKDVKKDERGYWVGEPPADLFHSGGDDD
jgi:hypothetical protein